MVTIGTTVKDQDHQQRRGTVQIQPVSGQDRETYKKLEQKKAKRRGRLWDAKSQFARLKRCRRAPSTKAQGVSVDRAFIYTDPLAVELAQQLLYVGTRGRYDVFYV